MSKIKEGDNVYVIGSALDLLCPHVINFLGMPLKVKSVRRASLICADCNRTWSDVDLALFDGHKPQALRLSWLKKIEPLAPEDHDEHYDEVPRISAEDAKKLLIKFRELREKLRSF